VRVGAGIGVSQTPGFGDGSTSAPVVQSGIGVSIASGFGVGLLVDNPTNIPAGRRKKSVLIDFNGRIHEFDTQEQANAFLVDIAPKDQTFIQAKAKRIAQAVIRTGNAFEPEKAPWKPVQVVSGEPELLALSNMYAAINQSNLNAAVQAQLAIEADEEAAMAIFMMMEEYG
jgi:hypothetical protein